MSNELITVVQPVGFSASTCGYCSDVPGLRSASKTSKHYGFFAHQMSPRVYQDLIDRGFRRSGAYLYRPEQSTTCCPQYTIRLDASLFVATRSQRHLAHKFRRFITTHTSQPADRKGKGRAEDPPFDLLAEFQTVESPLASNAHRFSVTTEPASFSQDKYALYKVYQERVHNDTAATESGFRRFLCDSPLTVSANGSTQDYGSFHQLYLLDGVLIGIGVVDILPSCVSSVYFIWHPDHASLSLGKLGALREIALAQILHRELPELRYYYMGYYIHTCAKMRYKGEYGPSYLLDPVENTFHPFTSSTTLLDIHKRALFAPATIARLGASLGGTDQPDVSMNDADDDDADDAAFPDPVPPGWLSPVALPASLLRAAHIWERGTFKPLLSSTVYRDPDLRRAACECLAALGEDMGGQVVLYLR